MSTTEGHAEGNNQPVTRLGIGPDTVVLELGYDDGCDEELRSAIEARTAHLLVDEEPDDVVDLVLMWWRADDGDLVDALVDAMTMLADGGVIWLFTPKSGRPGHVEPSDIGEAAPTAGLQQTSTLSAARDWTGSRLVARKSGGRR
ncbi:MAG: DUF3052 domain-containing protein [Actinomycetes bacterium]